MQTLTTSHQSIQEKPTPDRESSLLQSHATAASRKRRAPVAATLLLLSSAALVAQDFSHPDTEPAPQTALTQRANDALAAGNFAAALKLLTDLNTQTPHNAEILYDLGLTLEALGPKDAAAAPENTSQTGVSDSKPLNPEACYRQSIAADPTFAASDVALGLLLARSNRPTASQIEEARTEFLAATKLPDAAPDLKGRAFRALARLDLDPPALAPPDHQSSPNPTAAADDLLQALKLTSEQPADILLSAEIARTANDLPAAEHAYRRLLAVTPQDTAATAALAHVLLAEHHPADAEALLTPALDRNAGNPSLTAQLAEVYLASGDDAQVAKAVPLLEKLHSAHPEDSNIARLLARVYLETGHPDQADPLYASLLASQSAHPDPTLLDDRAEVLLHLHRPAEAEKLLKQAVADPSAFPTPDAFGDAATHLAFAAAEIDDPRITLQALTLRATVQQPSPSSLFLEATANDALHQSSKAVELYKKFLAAAGGDFPSQESQARQRLAELEHAK